MEESTEGEGHGIVTRSSSQRVERTPCFAAMELTDDWRVPERLLSPSEAHIAEVESVPGTPPSESVFRWVCSCGGVGRNLNETRWGAELGARSHVERSGRKRTP